MQEPCKPADRDLEGHRKVAFVVAKAAPWVAAVGSQTARHAAR